MNADRLTVKSSEALTGAVELARRDGNPLIYCWTRTKGS
jgi:hypothetical protein